MKECQKSGNCYWGDAFNPGYCAYIENMPKEAVCPKLVDHSEAAPAWILGDMIATARAKAVI